MTELLKLFDFNIIGIIYARNVDTELRRPFVTMIENAYPIIPLHRT
jgi:hypothetical protein